MMAMLCCMMLPIGIGMAWTFLSFAFQDADHIRDVPVFTGLIFCVVPCLVFFSLFLLQKQRRKTQLTGYIEQWNRTHSNGVTLSLGGGGTLVGKGGITTVVGSERGGNYESFYMSTWDWQGIMLRGYLHIFVNHQLRSGWCEANGLEFVPPVAADLQGPGQRLPAGAGGHHPPGGYLVPPGYALVPLASPSHV